jgi:MFS family permease
MLRRSCIRATVLAVLGAMVVTLIPTRAAAAQDDAAADTALLERYAPFVAVRTHLSTCGDGERFLPIAVDSILGRQDVVLRDADGTVIKQAPTVADLADGPEDRWIDLPGDALDPGCSYEKWFKELDAAPAIYGRVAHEGDATVAQYWLFWVFNQWNDVHEGDWEMVQVMFPAATAAAALDTAPTTYAFAQHEGSQYAVRADGGDVTLVEGQHPLVFSAMGSHASYFDSSVWFGKSAATGVGCDDTSGPHDVIQPGLIVLPSGNDPPTSGPFAWLSFRGHWGEQEPAFANGPTGPLMKEQWAEPVTWVDELGRDEAVAIPFASSPATAAFCRLTEVGSALFNRMLDRPWLILGLSALVLTALAVIVLRSSQGVLTRALRTFWRVKRPLVPACAMVAVGVGAAYVAQWMLLNWTSIGTLADLVGGSSAWAAPVITAAQAVVIIPMFAWAATVTLATVRPYVVAGPEAPRRSRKVRTFWILLLVTVTFGVAIFVFWPLAVLPSRWIVAPVVASRHRGSLRDALAESNRLVKGHWLRALGLLVTMLLLVLLAVSVGAIVLLLTSLTFTQAGAITGAVFVVLVPFLTLVLMEYHADLLDARAPDDAPVPVPSPAPASV